MGTLSITFVNGRTYEYEDVPENILDALISAPSAGQYFHANIKDIYSVA